MPRMPIPWTPGHPADRAEMTHHDARRRLREALGSARSLWRDFTGESAYQHYVQRHRLEHPDHEPMTERQFWRERARFDEDNVSSRCC